MNRSNVTTLTAILFAVGVISPAAFGGQFHPQADLTSLVVADSSGIQKGRSSFGTTPSKSQVISTDQLA